MADAVTIVQKAWASPRMRTWDPEKAPTCRVVVRIPREEVTGIALPPGYRGPVNAAISYTVDFRAEFGTNGGLPWYQIIGRTDKTDVLVAQGVYDRKG